MFCSRQAIGRLVLLMVFAGATVASAQLQITEILYDSLSSEPRWEWVEIRNSGGTAVDLNGYVLDDDDGAILLNSNISNATQSTMVPAGGVAVLYNANNIDDPQLFRDAWQLGGGVNLIGVTSAPGLNNTGGDHIGLWPTYTDYFNDSVDDGMGTLIVGGFSNAPANVNYAMFPGGGGASTAWNGSGSFQDIANWQESMVGVAGGVASVEITIGAAVNSIDDIANPGVVPAGPQAGGLLISEIMYNPRSPEPGWEWIEVVNNTGNMIDFAANNYYMDDVAGNALASANVTSGSIPDGGVAILYDDAILPADFATAWGGGLNAIPVSSFPSLNNGGDTIGLWDNGGDYNTDRTNGDFANAEVAIPYDDDGVNWPFDDGNGSIYLTDLNADATLGPNWIISFPGDGLSFNAMPVGGLVTEHNGDDIGSPGFVPDGMTIIDADFNDDMVIDGADIDLLTMDVANGTNNTAMFDLNGDGSVNYDDVVQWLADAGAANLLSMNPYLIGDANLDGTVDGQDFVIWNGNKFTTTGKWTQADFNADGNTDGQDFILWNGTKFTSADALAVPEPQTSALVGLLCAAVGLRRRR